MPFRHSARAAHQVLRTLAVVGALLCAFVAAQAEPAHRKTGDTSRRDLLKLRTQLARAGFQIQSVTDSEIRVYPDPAHFFCSRPPAVNLVGVPDPDLVELSLAALELIKTKGAEVKIVETTVRAACLDHGKPPSPPASATTK